MDAQPLTAEAVLAAEFREKLRGYHQEDVDDFLEQIANGVRDLHRRLAEATQRAEIAELQRSEAQPGEGEETLRRTLVLAQRTADAAIAEAREQAAQIVAAAQQEAERRLAEADRQAVEEVHRLHELREQLSAEVRSLQLWLDGERAQLREALASTLQQLDAGVPMLSQPPVVQPVQLPGRTTQPMADIDADDASLEAAPVADASAEAADVPAEAPPTDRPEDDAFIAELRRAVTDDTPLGPREDDDDADGEGFKAFVDMDDHDDDGRGGLGSRLRRRR